MIVNSYQPLYGSLGGEPKVAPGEVYVLKSWLGGYGSSTAFLFGSLGAVPPAPSVVGWIFLDPASLMFLGPAPIGGAAEIFVPVPASSTLLGLRLAFQALDGDLGLSRPVLAVVAP